MAKLPKSIIKKYGISKKAWAVYRSRNKRGRTTMARKKSKKSYSRKSKNIFSSDLGLALSGATYGFLRGKLEQPMANLMTKIPFIGDKIPADKIDNVGFGVLSYLLKKRKIPFIKNIQGSSQLGKAGLITEGVLLGSEIGKQTSSGSVDMKLFE